MAQGSIPIKLKLRVLLELRKHLTLDDEEFRQILINVLREYAEDPAAAAVHEEDADRLSASPIQFKQGTVDDEMRGKALDDFIAAARRSLGQESATTNTAEEQREVENQSDAKQ